MMQRLKPWLPTECIRLARHYLGYSAYFRGHYATWDLAEAAAQGYAADDILARVLHATREVSLGRASFERDGALFYAPDDPYALLAAILRAAALSDGSLRVIDFGGALGSSYFQCRPWLVGLNSVSWCVVEQPHFVNAGQTQFANHQLCFANTIAEATHAGGSDAIIFSGVLQYLPDASTVLQQALKARPRLILIDRTPTITGTTDRITVQTQSARGKLVASSYPIRLFALPSLMAVVGQGYRLLSSFQALDAPMGGIGSRVDFKGFLFEREGQ